VSDRTNPEQRVSAALHTATEHTEVPTAGIDAARHRGRTRHQRQRVAVGTTCAVVLVASAVTVWRLTEPPARDTISPETIATTEPPVTTISGIAMTTVPGFTGDPGTPVERIDPEYVWNLVQPDSAEAVSVDFTLAPGAGTTSPPYLMWSTSPGASPSGQYSITLYKSDDGIHWTPSGTSDFTEPDISRRGLSMLGDKLLAFGTAAATAAIPNGSAGDAVVEVSADGGATWSPTVLPVDIRTLADSPGVVDVGTNGGMAERNGTVVVVVETEPRWTAQATQDLFITPAGVRVNTLRDGAAPTYGELQPLAQFGIDPATVAARQTPRAFVSTDGDTWQEATFPQIPDDVVPDAVGMNVFATDAGFYAIFNGYRVGYAYSQFVYTSVDGRSWTMVAESSAQNGVTGVLPDGTLISTVSGPTASVGVSSDGATWQRYDLSPLIEPTDGTVVYLNLGIVRVGASGITILGNVYNDPIAEAGGQSLVHGNIRATVESVVTGLRFYDATTGEDIIPDWQRQKPDGSLDFLGPDGTVIATFTNDDMNSLMQPPKAPVYSLVLLHSTDGRQWSRENLRDLTGSANVGPGYIRDVNGSLIVTLIDSTTRVNGMATTLVLVGTHK
jgi:hypothetical protein